MIVTPPPGRVDELDALPAPACIDALAPLFEGAPGFLARLVAARPFSDAERLLTHAREIAHAMPEPEQLELIDAHPRLGAPPGSVSASSFREQGYDREPTDAAAGPVADAASGPVTEPTDAAADTDRALVARELERLNAAYEARFGFRYCVFVAGRPRAALLPGMEAALGADRETELHRALDAVIDIAAARLRARASVRS